MIIYADTTFHTNNLAGTSIAQSFRNKVPPSQISYNITLLILVILIIVMSVSILFKFEFINLVIIKIVLFVIYAAFLITFCSYIFTNDWSDKYILAKRILMFLLISLIYLYLFMYICVGVISSTINIVIGIIAILIVIGFVVMV